MAEYHEILFLSMYLCESNIWYHNYLSFLSHLPLFIEAISEQAILIFKSSNHRLFLSPAYCGKLHHNMYNRKIILNTILFLFNLSYNSCDE